MPNKVNDNIWFSLKLLQRSPGEPVGGEASPQLLKKNQSDREQGIVQGMLLS